MRVPVMDGLAATRAIREELYETLGRLPQRQAQSCGRCKKWAKCRYWT